MQVYNDPNPLNEDKWHLVALPDFHEETFPFVACSGTRSINLINVNTDYMEAFIETETTCWGQQQPFFFKKEEKGMTLHYSSAEQSSDERKYLTWVQMKLKPDFKKMLKKLGCLPITNLEEIVEIQLDNVDLEGELEFEKYLKKESAHADMLEVKQQIKKKKQSSYSDHPDF